MIITILIIIMIIINYSSHLFCKAFLFATKNLHPQYQFSTYCNIHFQSHFCQEQSNIKWFTLPHLSSWCQPFPVTTNQEHHYQNQCLTIINWGFSLFMNNCWFLRSVYNGIRIQAPSTWTYIILYITYYIVNYLSIYSLLSIQWYRDTRALNLDSSRGGVSLENEKTPQVSLTIGG